MSGRLIDADKVLNLLAPYRESARPSAKAMCEVLVEEIQSGRLSAQSPTPGQDGLMPVGHTLRGFELIDFRDRNDQPCTLQQSSAADYVQPGYSAIWLGVEDHRMHISREQVEKLVGSLNNWLESGSFKPPSPTSTGERE